MGLGQPLLSGLQEPIKREADVLPDSDTRSVETAQITLSLGITLRSRLEIVITGFHQIGGHTVTLLEAPAHHVLRIRVAQRKAFVEGRHFDRGILHGLFGLCRDVHLGIRFGRRCCGGGRFGVWLLQRGRARWRDGLQRWRCKQGIASGGFYITVRLRGIAVHRRPAISRFGRPGRNGLSDHSGVRLRHLERLVGHFRDQGRCPQTDDPQYD